MLTCRTVAELREQIDALRRRGKSVGFVPTMGWLHQGHVTLIRESVARCGATVVSIFVNPTQFGPREDFSAYPRDLANDMAMCAAAGVDIVFAPEADEVYPEGFQTNVEPGPLADVLCGPFRPGHFRGVATVVAKLFNMVQPDIAFFGQKDYQQAAIIRRMVVDLNIPMEVVALPTVREPDGLAMSSRNARLDADARRRAVCLGRGLFAAKAAYDEGERNVEKLIAVARGQMSEADSIQYLELVNARTLQPLGSSVDQPAVLAVAAFVGKVRLIDNVVLGGPRITGKHGHSP
jgi:pantoate--beta-alanine ligase